MNEQKEKLSRFKPEPKDAVLNEDQQLMVEIIERFSPGQGHEIVVAMSREFDGTYALFPKVSSIFRAPRDEWIRQQYDDGYPPNAIARAAKVGTRQFWNIVGKAPGEDKQLCLPFQGNGE